MKRNKGFTLIELLVVLAMILIVAAMVIPALIAARKAWSASIPPVVNSGDSQELHKIRGVEETLRSMNERLGRLEEQVVQIRMSVREKDCP